MDLATLILPWDRSEPLPADLDAALRPLVAAGHQVILTCDKPDGPHPDDGLSRVRCEAGDLGCGWRRALEAATGEVVLWLDPSLLPSLALVEAHLALHRGQRVVAVGLAGPPEDGPLTTLTLVLQAFDPLLTEAPSLRGDQLSRVHWSAKATSLRAVGGLRPDGPLEALLPDLGLRLEAAGVPLLPAPTLAAPLRDPPTLAAHQRATEARAEAWVWLAGAHPELLLRPGRLATLSRSDLRGSLERTTEERARAAVAALAPLDQRAIRASGESSRLLAGELSKRLAEAIQPLEARWWARGTLRGLESERVDALSAVLARHLHRPAPEEGPALAVVLYGEGALTHLDALEGAELPLERFAVGRGPSSEGVTLLSPEPQHPGRPLAEAAERATAPWILFLDGAPTPALLRGHLALLSSSWPHPTGLIGGRVPLAEPIDPFGRLAGRLALCGPQPGMRRGEPYRAASLHLGHLSLPLPALRAAGGLDGGWTHLAAEELDLGQRLQQRLGLTLRYEPVLSAIVAPPTLRAYLSRQYHQGWASWHLSRELAEPTRQQGDLRRWEALKERADREEPALLQALRHLDTLDEAALEPLVLRLGSHARRRGLQVAAGGFSPDDYRGGHPFPLELP
ncbi:MAG: hypothetical protein JXX28_05285 [Deltaproteobacteria bacterium]|nr:hypothetical protein [Deltaproteobacteria bacterium]